MTIRVCSLLHSCVAIVAAMLEQIAALSVCGQCVVCNQHCDAQAYPMMMKHFLNTIPTSSP